MAKVCDICTGRQSAQTRQLAFREFERDLCEYRWKEYQEAIKLLNSLFMKSSATSDQDWLTYRSRMLPTKTT